MMQQSEGKKQEKIDEKRLLREIVDAIGICFCCEAEERGEVVVLRFENGQRFRMTLQEQ